MTKAVLVVVSSVFAFDCHRWFFLFFHTLTFVTLSATTVLAEASGEQGESIIAQKNGFVCVGFNKTSQKWGWKHYRESWIKCPPHHAFFGVNKSHSRREMEHVSLHGNCCRLPADDILTEKHIESTTYCPDQFVATGLQGRAGNPKSVSHLRCTKINTDKYSLGKPHRGVRWGVESSAAFPWHERKSIRRNQIPMAIRYGIGRYLKSVFTVSGCVGEPIGSLLVGKEFSNCKGLFWKQLLRKTEDKGLRPVTMFPKCRDIDDVFSPDAKCLP